MMKNPRLQVVMSSIGVFDLSVTKYKILPYLKLMRPNQWTKNGFVLMPLIFGGRLWIPEDVLRATGALLSFCLAASAVYILNDYKDIDNDRIHPLKRNRPLASGVVSPLSALILVLVLILATFLAAILFRLPVATHWILAGYLFLNLLYSWEFKNWVIIDVLVVSSGFLLRVLAGGFAINIAVSRWLLLCTFSVATFLALGKRRHEVTSLCEEASGHRPVLESYGTNFIDQLLHIVTTSTLIFYCLYAVTSVSENMHSRGLLITIPFVTYGIFRYIYLIYQKGVGGSPTDLLLTDYPLLASVILWLICSVVVIYK